MLRTRTSSWLSLASYGGDDMSASGGRLPTHVREIFRDKIFPHIDEKPFSVLYSNAYSRPNTPANVAFGELVKEIFRLSDDEVVCRLMFDVNFQYALHTTSYAEQPLSGKTLSRFRKRRCECETGRDLIRECIKALARSSTREWLLTLTSWLLARG